MSKKFNKAEEPDAPEPDDVEDEDEPSGLDRLGALADEIASHKERIAAMEMGEDPVQAFTDLRDEMTESVLPLLLDVIECTQHAIMDTDEDVAELDQAVEELEEGGDGGDDDDDDDDDDDTPTNGSQQPGASDPDQTDEYAASALLPGDANRIAILLGHFRASVANAIEHANDPAALAAANSLLAQTDEALALVADITLGDEPDPDDQTTATAPDSDAATTSSATATN